MKCERSSAFVSAAHGTAHCGVRSLSYCRPLNRPVARSGFKGTRSRQHVPPRCMAAGPGNSEAFITAMSGSFSGAASTITGLGLLAFIVLVHETGHYLAARLQGIRVKDFSVGFGPKVIGWKPKNSETQFNLRLLPLGGFVAFPDDVEVDEESGEERKLDDPNLLQNRPALDRAIVISAGIIANIILAYAAIFTSVNIVGVPRYEYQPGVVISQLTDSKGPGAVGGLKRGDIVLALDGQAIQPTAQCAKDLATSIRGSNGRELLFDVKRGNEQIQLRVTPRCCTPSGDSFAGVQLSPNARVGRVLPSSPIQAMSMASHEFSRLAEQTFNGLVSIVRNTNGEATKNLSGPVGVISMGAELARNDQTALLVFMAVISLNLAVINALPLPGLDGGQMAFIIVEVLSGRPVPQRIQESVNRAAILLLLLLSGSLLVGDIEKLGSMANVMEKP